MKLNISLLPVLGICAQAQFRSHFGDNPRWADPVFDDSSWSIAPSDKFPIPPYSGNQAMDVESGLPLGIVADAEYAESKNTRSGQTLTFVSDGVVEASIANGELFGFDRTRDIADAAKAWGQNDDITAVTVRRSS